MAQTTKELEIAAEMLRQHYGEQAFEQAVRRARELEDAGKREEAEEWRLVLPYLSKSN